MPDAPLVLPLDAHNQRLVDNVHPAAWENPAPRRGLPPRRPRSRHRRPGGGRRSRRTRRPGRHRRKAPAGRRLPQLGLRPLEGGAARRPRLPGPAACGRVRRARDARRPATSRRRWSACDACGPRSAANDSVWRLRDLGVDVFLGERQIHRRGRPRGRGAPAALPPGAGRDRRAPRGARPSRTRRRRFPHQRDGLSAHRPAATAGGHRRRDRSVASWRRPSPGSAARSPCWCAATSCWRAKRRNAPRSSRRPSKPTGCASSPTADFLGVQRPQRSKVVQFELDGNQHQLPVDEILVATGRAANVHGARPRERRRRLLAARRRGRRPPADDESAHLRLRRRRFGAPLHPPRGCPGEDRDPERALRRQEEGQRAARPAVHLHFARDRPGRPPRGRAARARDPLRDPDGAAGGERPRAPRRRRRRTGCCACTTSGGATGFSGRRW